MNRDKNTLSRADARAYKQPRVKLCTHTLETPPTTKKTIQRARADSSYPGQEDNRGQTRAAAPTLLT